MGIGRDGDVDILDKVERLVYYVRLGLFVVSGWGAGWGGWSGREVVFIGLLS